jgi:transcription antitermination factor NusA-like protein
MSTSPTLKRPYEDDQELSPVKRLNTQDSPVANSDLFVIDTKPSDSLSQNGSEDGELPEEVIEAGETVPIHHPQSLLKDTPDDLYIKMRSLVNTREAGIIIGKQGSHIAEIQDETGMKVMVSQFMQNNADRVMTCLGSLKGYSSAMHKVLKRLIEKSDYPDEKEITVRLLVPSSRMGFVIGKSGANIKEIQEKTGARISSKGDNLPNSTERCMSIEGDEDAVVKACYEIAVMVGDHHERNDGPPMLYFDPTSKANLRVSTRRDSSPSRSDYSPRSRSPEPISNPHPAQLQAQLGALYAYYPQLQLLAQYPQLLAQYPQMMGQYQQFYPNAAQQASPSQTSPIPGLDMQSLNNLQQTLQGLNPSGQSNPLGQNMQNIQALQSLSNMNQQQQYQSNSNESVKREISIPSNIVGAFIGKKGSSIKEIRNRTQCKVTCTY